MKHIILAGDSIFDNRSYVNPGEPDVIKQLESLLATGDKATLLAVDGAVITNVAGQLKNRPGDTTHLFISVGGNDGLYMLDSFLSPVSSMGEGFLKFNPIRQDFEKKYSKMLRQALKVGLQTAVCTIYHPRFESTHLERMSGFIPPGIAPSDLQKVAMNLLSIINDIIFQEAVKSGVPIVDLRIIFNEDRDFANPIEPSMLGGAKMTKVIKRVAYEHDFSLKKTVVFT